MADATTVEELARDIRQRLDANDETISERTSDEHLAEIVRGVLDGMTDDEASEFSRKIRFAGGNQDRELVGTKYARRGLSLADVEFLHDMQRSLKGQRRTGENGGFYDGPSEELQRTFDAASDAFYLTDAEMAARDARAVEATGDVELVEAYQRAMDTAESGYGSQLIGAQYVGELWEAPRRLGRVFPLIESFEMDAPVAYLPIEADLPEMILVSESTANNSSNYDTQKTGSNRVTVTAKKFVIHQMWSGEMDEDSIIPFVPFLRRQGAASVAHYSDSLVLNGDTTNAGTGNINLDDADPADTKHYLAFDGIRHAALVDNTSNGRDVSGAYTFADFMAAKGLMLSQTYLQDWGHPTDPNDLVYVADPGSVDAISLLDEIITADKYGAGATVLNGEQARIMRHPLIASQAVSLTEADGKVSTTGSNNVKGQTVVFNRRGFVAGWRRQVKTEVERLPASDQTRIVHSLRLGFGRYAPSGSASSIEAAAVLYNATI